MLKFKKEKTTRGFDRYHFADLYNAKCSMQMSSLATKNAIWLGADDVTQTTDYKGNSKILNTRMHLDRKMSFNLAIKLLIFSITGKV